MIEHEDCKYYFKSEVEKLKRVYSSLHDGDHWIDYKEPCGMCAVGPSAVELISGQPRCEKFEEKR